MLGDSMDIPEELGRTHAVPAACLILGGKYESIRLGSLPKIYWSMHGEFLTSEENEQLYTRE